MDLHGTVLGGATLEVPFGGMGGDQGQLVIHGALISEFTIGGQELWIDHICQRGAPVIPECELDLYTAHVRGPAHGGNPHPLATGWTYPSVSNAQLLFLNRLHGMGLNHQMITFEKANGWSPVIGTGDMFAGAGAPYPGGVYTSAALGATGNGSLGTAAGRVEYTGADNKVLFMLHNNGHWGGPAEPGIGDMDADNDTDRGINTTPGGAHFLEAMPSEHHEGGLKLEFKRPVPAVGMYVMGLEKGKREVELKILRADGIIETRTTDLVVGPRDVGGIQFLGYVVSDLKEKDCWIKAVKFAEKLEDGDPGRRDIFSIDDVIYAAREVNQPVDTPDPWNPDIPNLDIPERTPVTGGKLPILEELPTRGIQTRPQHEKTSPGMKPGSNAPSDPAKGNVRGGKKPEEQSRAWTQAHDELQALVLLAGLNDEEAKSLTRQAMENKKISNDAIVEAKQWLNTGLSETDVDIVEAMSSLAGALLDRAGCHPDEATELGSVIAVGGLLLEHLDFTKAEAHRVSIDAVLIWKQPEPQE
jgi:hypothetical protein